MWTDRYCQQNTLNLIYGHYSQNFGNENKYFYLSFTENVYKKIPLDYFLSLTNDTAETTIFTTFRCSKPFCLVLVKSILLELCFICSGTKFCILILIISIKLIHISEYSSNEVLHRVCGTVYLKLDTYCRFL